MPRSLKTTALFLTVVLMLVLPAFAARTILKPAWNLFSVQQDIEMGRVLADDLERNLQLVDDHNSNTYIDALGKQLIAHAPGDRYPYQFKIVNDANINAWALPGGFIYVTSGLIETAQNEPQLAGVLAHEIGHVILRHGTAEVSNAYADLAPNTSRNRASVNDAMSRLNIRFEPTAVPLKYSREEERQADVIATQVMYDAGFDPQQAIPLFQKIASGRSSRTADFFDAHPDLPNRAAVVRTELRNLGPLAGNLRGDSPDFHSVQNRVAAAPANSWPSISDRSISDRKRGIDNRAEAPSTRTAVYSGRDIEFRYPDNWRVADHGDSVSTAPDSGFVNGLLAYGMTIATFEPQGSRYFGRNSFSTQGSRVDTTGLASATDQLIDHLQRSNPNMRVVRNNERRRVDGSPAMVVELTNDSPAGGSETDWLVAVMRPNGMLKYFVGVAPQNAFNRYGPAFENIVASVRFLD